MSVDSIPKQLQYGASASVARVVRVSNLRPAGTDSGTYGDSFRFDLPSRSIVDLGSLSLYYTSSLTGLIDGVNGVNAVQPCSWKHFKRVVFYVSGIAASGSLNQHMDLLYHALVKASGSHEWLLSRLNKNAIEAVLSTDECAAHQTLAAQPGATTKACHTTYDDFLGLPRSKNIIDQSLWGQVSVEVQMADAGMLKCRPVAGGTGTNNQALAVAFSVSNMRASVDVLQSVSPLYISLLSSRMSASDAPIRLPYQDVRTFVSQNTGSVRTNVNTNCLDAVMAVALSANYNTPVITALAESDPIKFKFDSGRNLASANTLRAQFQISQDTYPRTAIENAFEVADITMNGLHGMNRDSTALLFASASDDSTIQYRRAHFLANNFIYFQKLSLNAEGYKDGVLTGISTNGQSSEIIFNSTNFGTNVLIAQFCTSCLVFNPANSSVSVEA
jgi:hypothetical protein